MSARPRLQIARHSFGIARATVAIEVRDAAEAARMRVPAANIAVEVDGVPGDMPGVAASISWFSPKAYLDTPLALDEVGIRSCANISFSARARSALYTYKHQTLAEATLSVTDTDGMLQLEWTGETLVGLDVVPVHIVATAKLMGVIAYSHDPRVAREMAHAALPNDDLDELEVTITDPGRKKFVLFGPVLGRTGNVRFMPRARAALAPRLI